MKLRTSIRPSFHLKPASLASSSYLSGRRTFVSPRVNSAKGIITTDRDVAEPVVLKRGFKSRRARIDHEKSEDALTNLSSNQKRSAVSGRLHGAFPGPSSTRQACPEPIKAVTQSQTHVLDPTGSRTRLFWKGNPDAAKVGDVLLVKQKSSDPFAGVCIDIRRRGIDTAICLRNSLTRVGVEVWFKVYSPAVESIEIAQRKEKRARRARLYYMRKPKHDVGSVANILHRYQKDRIALLGSSRVKGRDANSRSRKSKGAKI